MECRNNDPDIAISSTRGETIKAGKQQQDLPHPLRQIEKVVHFISRLHYPFTFLMNELGERDKLI